MLKLYLYTFVIFIANGIATKGDNKELLPVITMLSLLAFFVKLILFIISYIFVKNNIYNFIRRHLPTHMVSLASSYMANRVNLLDLIMYLADSILVLIVACISYYLGVFLVL